VEASRLKAEEFGLQEPVMEFGNSAL